MGASAQLVDQELPPDTAVLVVSNGDGELLDLGANRQGLHFPQMEDGTYAGYHPGTSAEAISHLQALCEKGAEYILFPHTAGWWLEYYTDLVDYLRDHYRETFSDPETCVIFRLEATHEDAESALVQEGSDDV